MTQAKLGCKFVALHAVKLANSVPYVVQHEWGSQEGEHVRGEGHLGNALLNVHTHNDGVLLVEDTGRQDAQDAGEHCIKLGCFLLLIFHLKTDRNYGFLTNSFCTASQRAC